MFVVYPESGDRKDQGNLRNGQIAVALGDSVLTKARCLFIITRKSNLPKDHPAMSNKSLLSILLLAALSTACTGTRIVRPSPDYVRVTGTSSALTNSSAAAAAETSAPSGPAFAGTELTASAIAPRPAGSPGAETSRLIARQTAMGMAYRDLAGQIQQIVLPNGQTVANSISSDTIRQQLENMVTQARVVEESEQPDGSYSVKLALRTDPLGPIFGYGSENSGTPLTGLTMTAPPVASPAQLQTAADRAAREQLMNKIRIAPTNKVGERIGDYMQEHPDFAEQVRGMVQAAPASAPRQMPDGSWQVDIQFDVAAVRNAMK